MIALLMAVTLATSGSPMDINVKSSDICKPHVCRTLPGFMVIRYSGGGNGHFVSPGHMQTFWNLIKTDHDYVTDSSGNNRARPYTTNMSTFYSEADCAKQQNIIANSAGDSGDGVICVPIRKWVSP